MKLVVFGSRSFDNKERIYRILDCIYSETPELEIISGTARGADSLGEEWASDRGVLCHYYPADWSQGKSAGHRRNAVMADVAEQGLCFWDGESPGTKGMLGFMKQRGKGVMLEKYVPVVKGNLWDAHAQGQFVVITTNTQTRKDGTAVMGAGIALSAAEKCKGLAANYGKHLTTCEDPEKPVYLEKQRLILLPTKRHWRDPSPMDLVEKNILWLKKLSETHPEWKIAIPPMGCSNGQLDWPTQVQPLVDEHLSNGKFTVYDNR